MILAIISSDILSSPLFLFSFWDCYYVYVGLFDDNPQVSEALFSFLSFCL